MNLFRVRKKKKNSNAKPQEESRAIKRLIILNNQNQEGFKIESDWPSILSKCKQDLELLKKEVINFTRELELP